GGAGGRVRGGRAGTDRHGGRAERRARRRRRRRVVVPEPDMAAWRPAGAVAVARDRVRATGLPARGGPAVGRWSAASAWRRAGRRRAWSAGSSPRTAVADARFLDVDPSTQSDAVVVGGRMG